MNRDDSTVLINYRAVVAENPGQRIVLDPAIGDQPGKHGTGKQVIVLVLRDLRLAAPKRWRLSLVHGTAKVDGQGDVTVVGVVDGTPLSVDGAIVLAGHVLATVEAGDGAPIVFLVDTASQNMARGDELLGLNDYLAHLYKSLALASLHGHRTVSVLFGHAAAGAFIAVRCRRSLWWRCPVRRPV